ncbi:hypothetical protein [Holospora undulata]|uniref:Uncharacterized protein n=1 Tax=Holospora undulata HU1 TaxID=1321371 RepID=A0A061JIZ3_9PROT|nr:hypothetical protein [Holospora undulata]ETZ05414.1 hypothetical protein K737_300144 [Holospora undulata HU1]
MANPNAVLANPLPANPVANPNAVLANPNLVAAAGGAAVANHPILPVDLNPSTHMSPDVCGAGVPESHSTLPLTLAVNNEPGAFAHVSAPSILPAPLCSDDSSVPAAPINYLAPKHFDVSGISAASVLPAASINFPAASMYSDIPNEFITFVNISKVPLLFGISSAPGNLSAPVPRIFLDDFQKNLNLGNNWRKIFNGLLRIDFAKRLSSGGREFCASLANQFNNLRVCFEGGTFKLKQIVFSEGKETVIDCSSESFNAIVKALDKLSNPEQMKIFEEASRNNFEVFLKFLELKNISSDEFSEELKGNFARQFSNLRIFSENGVLTLKRRSIFGEQEVFIECSDKMFDLMVRALDSLDVSEQTKILEETFEDLRVFLRYLKAEKVNINDLPKELRIKIAKELFNLRTHSENGQEVLKRDYLGKGEKKLIECFDEEFLLMVRALDSLDVPEQTKILEETFEDLRVFLRYLKAEKVNINDLPKELRIKIAKELFNLRTHSENGQEVLKRDYLGKGEKKLIECFDEEFLLMVRALDSLEESRRILILEKVFKVFRVFEKYIDSIGGIEKLPKGLVKVLAKKLSGLKISSEREDFVQKPQKSGKENQKMACSEEQFVFIVKALERLDLPEQINILDDVFFSNFEIFQKYIDSKKEISNLNKELLTFFASKLVGLKISSEGKNPAQKMQKNGKENQKMACSEEQFVFIVKALERLDLPEQINILDDVFFSNFEIFQKYIDSKKEISNLNKELLTFFASKLVGLKISSEGKNPAQKMQKNGKENQKMACSEEQFVFIVKALERLDLPEQINVLDDVFFNNFEIFQKYIDSKKGVGNLNKKIIKNLANHIVYFSTYLEKGEPKLQWKKDEKKKNPKDTQIISRFIAEALKCMNNSDRIEVLECAADKDFEVFLRFLDLENISFVGSSDKLSNKVIEEFGKFKKENNGFQRKSILNGKELFIKCSEERFKLIFNLLNQIESSKLNKTLRDTFFMNFEIFEEYVNLKNGIVNLPKKLISELAKEFSSFSLCLENKVFKPKLKIVIEQKEKIIDNPKQKFDFIIETLRNVNASERIHILEEAASKDFEVFLSFPDLENISPGDFSYKVKSRFVEEFGNLKMGLENKESVIKRTVNIDDKRKNFISCSERIENLIFKFLKETSEFKGKEIEILKNTFFNNFEIFQKYLILKGGIANLDLRLLTVLAEEFRNLKIFIEKGGVKLKRNSFCVQGQKYVDCPEKIRDLVFEALSAVGQIKNLKLKQTKILEEALDKNFEVFLEYFLKSEEQFFFDNQKKSSDDEKNLSGKIIDKLAKESVNLRAVLENEVVVIKREVSVNDQKVLLDCSGKIFDFIVKSFKYLKKPKQKNILEDLANKDLEVCFKFLDLEGVNISDFSRDLRINFSKELSNLSLVLENGALVLKRKISINKKEIFINCSDKIFSVIREALAKLGDDKKRESLLEDTASKDFEVFLKFLDLEHVGVSTLSKNLKSKLGGQFCKLRGYLKDGKLALRRNVVINGQETVMECSDKQFKCIVDALEFLNKSDRIVILENVAKNNFEVFLKYANLEIICIDNFSLELKKILANQLSNLRVRLENGKLVLKQKIFIDQKEIEVDYSKEIFERIVSASEKWGKPDCTRILEAVSNSDFEVFLKFVELKNICIDDFSQDLKFKLATQLNTLMIRSENKNFVLKRKTVVDMNEVEVSCSEREFKHIVNALDQLEHSKSIEILKELFSRNFEVFQKYLEYKGGMKGLRKELILELAKEVYNLRTSSDSSNAMEGFIFKAVHTLGELGEEAKSEQIRILKELFSRNFEVFQKYLDSNEGMKGLHKELILELAKEVYNLRTSSDSSNAMEGFIFKAVHTLGELGEEAKSEQIRILKELFSGNFEVFQKCLQFNFSETLVENFKDLLEDKFLKLIVFPESMQISYFDLGESKQKIYCTEEMLNLIVNGIRKFSENKRIGVCERFLSINKGDRKNRCLFLENFFAEEMKVVNRNEKNIKYLTSLENDIFFRIACVEKEAPDFWNLLKERNPENFRKIVKNVKSEGIKEIKTFFEKNHNKNIEESKNNNQSCKKKQLNNDFKSAIKNAPGYCKKTQSSDVKSIKKVNETERKFNRAGGCCVSNLSFEVVKKSILQDLESSVDKIIEEFKVVKSANEESIEELKILQSTFKAKLNHFFVFSQKTIQNNDNISDDFSKYLRDRYGDNISEEIKKGQKFILETPNNMYQTLFEAVNQNVKSRKFKNFFTDRVRNFIQNSSFSDAPSVIKTFLENFFKENTKDKEGINNCVRSCFEIIDNNDTACQKYFKDMNEYDEFKNVLDENFRKFNKDYRYDFLQENEKSDLYAYFELERLFKNVFERFCNNTSPQSTSFENLKKDIVLTLIKINAYDE